MYLEFRDYSLANRPNATLTDDVCCNELPKLGFRKNYCCAAELYASITPEYYNLGNLANSSSKGPTRDLRIKPDAVRFTEKNDGRVFNSAGSS